MRTDSVTYIIVQIRIITIVNVAIATSKGLDRECSTRFIAWGRSERQIQHDSCVSKIIEKKGNCQLEGMP